MRVRLEIVYRRSLDAGRSSVRELLWRIEETDTGQQTRRTLIGVATGVVIDDVWLDEDDRTRSYEAAARKPRRGRPESDAPDRGEAAAVELVGSGPGGGCDGNVVEDCCDDRVLPCQGQGLPALR